MDISVIGIGWVTGEAFGRLRTGLQKRFEPGEGRGSLAKAGLFSHAFKNFGRMDEVSKTTAYAVALALRDAGVDYAPGRKQDIGLVGTSRDGSLATDREYFRDYLDGGRKLSRGNLFIYTLPSSPLGESAIHFGLQGPLLFAAASGDPLVAVLDMAASILAGREASMMLAGMTGEEEALFLLLACGAPAAVCSLAEAREKVRSTLTVSGIVQKFAV